MGSGAWGARELGLWGPRRLEQERSKSRVGAEHEQSRRRGGAGEEQVKKLILFCYFMKMHIH